MCSFTNRRMLTHTHRYAHTYTCCTSHIHAHTHTHMLSVIHNIIRSFCSSRHNIIRSFRELQKLRMMLGMTDSICPPRMLLYTATSNLYNTGPPAGVLGLLQGYWVVCTRVISTIPLQEARAENTPAGALPYGGGQKTAHSSYTHRARWD